MGEFLTSLWISNDSSILMSYEQLYVLEIIIIVRVGI